MGSEDQVLNLMRLLDDGIREAEQIENKLDDYDGMLAVSSSLKTDRCCFLDICMSDICIGRIVSNSQLL